MSRRNLDRLFEEQDEISQCMFHRQDNGASVSERLKSNGFTLLHVLIRGIEPDKSVKESMNKINASLRLREAATNEAEAKYIAAVREAEADRDRKRLLGEGVSQQRLAILKGYEEGIDTMVSKFGLTPQNVVDFVLRTQHLDCLETIGKSHNCKTVFVDHSVMGAGASLTNQLLVAQADNHRGDHTSKASESRTQQNLSSSASDSAHE